MGPSAVKKRPLKDVKVVADDRAAGFALWEGRNHPPHAVVFAVLVVRRYLCLSAVIRGIEVTYQDEEQKSAKKKRRRKMPGAYEIRLARCGLARRQNLFRTADR
jgi:hypothetical protein